MEEQLIAPSREERDWTKAIARIEAKVDMVYASAEKTRKYFLWMLIGTVLVFVLPLVGLVFAIPALLSTYSGLVDPSLLQGI